ncbi:MAG: TRAP transporter small permease [Deltaproteobacteria bacterium]|nr:TRAP transporter small permease [Deltaproteobacteria bacterium]
MDKQTAGGVWRRFEAAVERLSRLTGYLGAVSVLAAALIVTEGVVVRKVLGWSTTWQIELSVFLLMYACFVGAAYAQTREGHLNVDLLIVHFSPRAREILIIVVSVLSWALCGLIAWYAWPMWWEAVVHNDHSESLWGPPLWIPYFFLPFGMTLLFLQYVVTIVRKIKVLREGTFETEVTRAELREIEIPPPAGTTDGRGTDG